MRIKICGAVRTSDVELLAGMEVDLVGLRHGVAGGRGALRTVHPGRSELSAEAFLRLAAFAMATRRLRPVLVTAVDDVGWLRDVLTRSGVRWVQLHGHQGPGAVRALKTALPPWEEPVTVVKVLRVRGGDCVERSLVPAYERAGVDLFLIDAESGNGHQGGQGHQGASEAVARVADRLSRPFLLAGGASARRDAEIAPIVRHPLFYGIDVDAETRVGNGRLHPDRLEAVHHAWRTHWVKEWMTPRRRTPSGRRGAYAPVAASPVPLPYGARVPFLPRGCARPAV
ncbi:phosphoribosylanthranilate isomerase [Streptoalloteichus tenebrarius]|uniref:Phosphoribosylanthranilate isomerase n=1 Tax=Streptoalloteichus tenebrarius (strain ATCC 17920 / DSM 40477 / JCM 4838 / CBS 697.72 / NBRC 16177 / NCIMB 11028 / NRRL B-12390 / A12253. 1 / ISP 5477) TaxID=1933 RepID=A0ABT1HQH4_STRSD|nr:hypothetical protein [Streptoalloteichus tenebrarius]MCP2257762.1 phosphoribosylanthranilate isomerase [Streptoalloteichus tenebrarius]BFE99878.1 hypothetical protein GCM10020241_15540 [Streptoalloteichus tenebrarius]